MHPTGRYLFSVTYGGWCRIFGADISATADIAAHDSELLHAGLERTALHPQHGSSAAGTADNPVGGIERVEDMPGLGIVHGQDSSGGVRTGFMQVVFGNDEASARS